FCIISGVPWACMTHTGRPASAQKDPRYDNVALDVYDYLDARIEALVATGIPRSRIIADPGIGFGKTLEHNLTLLQNLALFHGLGCPILLGASRKRFIGTIGGTEDADARIPGSLAVTLAGVAQGIQLHRVHDVAETAEALKLWTAATRGI
ncbi:MAG: dihydropteroate synthase, partial [Pseudomonadota bacterium]